MAIVVVGSVALDSITTRHGRFKDLLGGSATYFSLGARNFTDVKIVAAIGNDLKASYLKPLKHPKIDLSGLVRVRGNTFRWSGSYGKDFQSRTTTSLSLGVFAGFKPVIPPRHRSSSCVFLANIDPRLQSLVLEQMKRPRLIAVDTIDHWIKNETDALLKLLRKTDMIFLNEEEARLLTQMNSHQKMGNWLRRRGPSIIVIKQGWYGAIGWVGKAMAWVPAYPVDETKDPTGAGDSFAGGVLGILDSSSRIDENVLRNAMLCGSVIGSFCVEGIGVAALQHLETKGLKKRLKNLKRISGSIS